MVGDDFQIPNAGLVYDLVTLLEQLDIKSPAPVSPEEMLKKLKLSGNHNGVSGEFQFVQADTGDKYYRNFLPVCCTKPVQQTNGQEVSTPGGTT